jgi:G2/mitotic-specific cyclin-B, other
MAMQHKKTTTSKVAKRAYTGQIGTTPVANTFGSLVLGDKRSPLFASSAPELKTINEDAVAAAAAIVHDIDAEDKHDATAVWQYAEDLTKYHLETEKGRMPSPSYMARQSDLNSKMRAILIDWLVDVHLKYNLNPQTLHIAIHLIDRHLEKNLTVIRGRLQLVGVTALFIASKYEEIYPPEADDFVKITDNAYTREELFSMEVDMLTSVGYRVTFPTAYQFMKRFLKASRTCDDRVEHFAHFVIDRTLQEYKMIKHAPSRLAAAAVHIARTQMNDLPAWVRPKSDTWGVRMETDWCGCFTERDDAVPLVLLGVCSPRLRGRPEGDALERAERHWQVQQAVGGAPQV